MSQHKLHWSDKPLDLNLRPTKFWTKHINRPRMSSETILSLLALKSEIMGTKLDILKEAEEFEIRNGLV